MEITNPEIQAYAESLSLQENDILKKINRETHLQVTMPNMISGQLQGGILAMITGMLQPSKILEVGTFTGYSAIWMAKYLPENSKIYTIDKNEELAEKMRSYFREAEISQQVELIIGEATEIIPGLDHTFDLVFIDADKANYINYYEMVLPKMPPGGHIIADNVLWHGKVISQQERENDKETAAIHQFNQYVYRDDRVDNVIFPVRDGLMIIRKL